MEKVKLSISLKNRLMEIEKLKEAVAKMEDSIQCTKRKLKEVDLVLEELFTNIVNHGFSDNDEHDIEISMSCDKGELEIRMEDDGKPFDITKAEAPDTKCSIEKRCIGGLGIHFIKHFIDECKYYRNKDKNIVVLKKTLESEKTD